VSPHVQVTMIADGSKMANAGTYGNNPWIRLEFVATKERGRYLCGFSGVGNYGTFSQDPVTPHKHITIIWSEKKNMLYTSFGKYVATSKDAD